MYTQSVAWPQSALMARPSTRRLRPSILLLLLLLPLLSLLLLLLISIRPCLIPALHFSVRPSAHSICVQRHLRVDIYISPRPLCIYVVYGAA